MTCLSLQAQDGRARAGTLHTAHGDLQTPVFMPVGTQASVKTVSPQELTAAGVRILLANAYHLYLRPGAAVIAAAGGLHGFMGWPHAILTDSGGFQVFSLARLSRVDDEGYHFASHLDGSRHSFTPESVVALQGALGSDIAMVLDGSCPAGIDGNASAGQRRADAALGRARPGGARTRGSAHVRNRTGLDIRGAAPHGSAARWRPWIFQATRSAACGSGNRGDKATQRWPCVRRAAGRKAALSHGRGTPEDILDSIARGVDMFRSAFPDPCRAPCPGAHRNGPPELAQRDRTRDDSALLDEHCDCIACTQFSRHTWPIAFAPASCWRRAW